MPSFSALQDQFENGRQESKQRIAESLVKKMGSLVGHQSTADLLLVSADGRKLPAHLCILRRRAPVFCRRYVEPTLVASALPVSGRSPLEVTVGDVDSAGLAFFVRSVYTDDEINQLPSGELNSKDRDEDKGGGHDSGLQHKDGDSRPKPQRNEFCDGLSEEAEQDSRPSKSQDSRKETADDSLESSMNTSTTHLCDVTNYRESESAQMPIGMSASFPSPDDLRKRMTSFAELASRRSSEFCGDSPMCSSTCSEVDELGRRSRSVTSASSCKFIRLDENVASQSISSRSTSRTRNPPQSKSFFYTVGAEVDPMTQSAPSNESGSIRTRAILARRLSVSSLTSLTSIDLTPTHELLPLAPTDRSPASGLGADLLSLFIDGLDTDVTIVVDAGELRAHRCILWATCPAFRSQLAAGDAVDLSRYSKPTVHFLLSFLYGGITHKTDDVGDFELGQLAEELQLDELIEVVVLNLRYYRCHFFHRPCASCVSAVFDALPQLSELNCLKSVRDEALAWQSRHFARIWKGRVFLHLPERWQRECFDVLLSSINEETVVDVLLGCEKLQIALPRLKAQHTSQFVQRLVADILEFCTDFLISAFDGVIASKAFVQQGRGLALNLSLLEDVLPTLVHSLSADIAIRSFICLKQLLTEIADQNQLQRVDSLRSISGSSLSLQQSEEFNPRFLHLCRRLYDLADKHLLHYAASVLKAPASSLLTAAEQSRIQTEGIFVEMRLPKAPPPRLSSFNRSYKRSSSVGYCPGTGGAADRARSLERPRPVGTFSQVLEADEPMEAIIEREKSQPQIHLHRRAVNTQPDGEHLGSRSKAAEISKIPSKAKRNRQETQEAQLKSNVASSTPDDLRSKESNNENRSLAARTVATKKPAAPSPSRRQPARHPAPVAQSRPLSSQPENNLERQNTQTIMTAAQIRDRGIDPKAHLPEVAPLNTSTETLVITSPTPTTSNDAAKLGKPRSVVRPMPKSIPTPATQTRKSTTSTAAKVSTRSALLSAAPNPLVGSTGSRSSAPLSIDGRSRRAETTKIPQSPGKRRRGK